MIGGLNMNINVPKNDDSGILHRLFELAHKRGIKIYSDFDLGENIFGLCVNFDGIKRIGLSSRLSLTAAIYVLSHELGHCQLHAAKVNYALYHKRDNYYDSIEQQADRFAARLIKVLNRSTGVNHQMNIDGGQ
jgi:Zn-dependent peptidase ImmA (M78 family)